MKKSKKQLVFPHIVLLTEGRLFLLLGAALPFIFIYGCFRSSSVKEIVFITAVNIVYLAVFIFTASYLWPLCFGELLVSDESIKWRCLFMPSCKIDFKDMKYIDIRKFTDGNVIKSSPYTGAFEYLLISTEPLPRIRIDKIKNSKVLIKFQLSTQACKVLSERMPAPYNRMFAYRLQMRRVRRK